MTSTKRALTALATGALALPLIYAPAAYAQTAPLPGTQSYEPFCSTVPDGFDAFTDDDGLPAFFQDAINCIAFADVTSGVTATTFVPERNVNRDAMASFVAQLIDRANELEADGESLEDLPPADAVPSFTDIDGNTHEDNIERLAQADIVNGGPGDLPVTQYGPGGNVTRGQMATFIVQALEFLLDDDLSTTNDYFSDDEGNTHESNINTLASLGIVTGTAASTYSPNAFIDRDNMAVFLARTLAELAERGLIDAAPEQQFDELAVTPDDDVVRVAVDNPDETGADDRTYTVDGLVAGVEYRVTIINEASTSRDDDGQLVFSDTFNGAMDDNLAETGGPTADLIEVAGAAPVNNGGSGTAETMFSGTTAVFTADDSGTATFVVDGDTAAETVFPIVYRNGGGDTDGSPEQGGASGRLEINDDGTAAEAFDEGGSISFINGDELAVTPDDDVVRVAVDNPDETGADDRTYTVDGLVAGVEYRVTIINEASTSRDDDGQLVFSDTFNGAMDDNLAETGGPTADLIEVAGAAPVNNGGSGTAETMFSGTTAVFTADDSGTATFVVDGDTAAETVFPIVYRNGGGDTDGSPEQGGASGRLEINDDGTAAEAFDEGGSISFINGDELAVTPDDDVVRVAVDNPDETGADDRTYTVDGLVAGVEYRVTIINEASTSRDDDGQLVFSDTFNGAMDDNLAETGGPTADLIEVAGAAPVNNGGSGTAETMFSGTTAVFTADDSGTATFVVDGDTAAETVFPIVYRNGGGDTDGSPEQGGASGRLEINDDGTAAEAFDEGGRITFS